MWALHDIRYNLSLNVQFHLSKINLYYIETCEQNFRVHESLKQFKVVKLNILIWI